ncbi:MAG: L,D-transpeptidase [Kyrpidia sp.]|nr:L,D-transpeptidase [Kyrpidia sp.]
MRGKHMAATAILALGLAGCGTMAGPLGPGGGGGQPGSPAGGLPNSPATAQGQPAGSSAQADSLGYPANSVPGQGVPPGPGSSSSGGNTAVAGSGPRVQGEAPAADPSQLTMDELKQRKNLWIDCNLSQQRIYIKDGDQVLKEMVTSSGLDTNPDNSTPRGTFQIGQRDTWFYNAQEKEGAMYWVAFKGLEFLFHSVPMDQNQHIIQSEADKLGQKASHGCFRLSMADAKWFYDNIPPGTKVVIHD